MIVTKELLALAMGLVVKAADRKQPEPEAAPLPEHNEPCNEACGDGCPNKPAQQGERGAE